MQCHEFDERLHLLLDDRQAPQRDGLLLAHASECGSCREVLLAQETLLRSFGRSCAPLPRPGFSLRVLEHAQVVALARRESPFRSRFVAGVCLSAAAAAAALVAITVAWFAGPPRPAVPATADRRTSDQANEPENRLAADAPSAVKAKPRRRSPSRPEQAVASTGDGSVADGAQSIEQYGQVLQSIASRVPDAVERLDEVEEATPGLRPVRTSFTLAIGTIRRTIPPRPKRAPPKPAKTDSGMIERDAPLPV